EGYAHGLPIKRAETYPRTGALLPRTATMNEMRRFVIGGSASFRSVAGSIANDRPPVKFDYSGDTQQVSVFLPGGGDSRTVALGMKVGRHNRLYVAGGPLGQIFVYDITSRALIAKFTTGVSPTFINDVTIAPNGDAYFTDSFSPFLYRVAADVTSA